MLDRRKARLMCPEDGLQLSREYIGIATPVGDGGFFKILKVLNVYDKKTCILEYGRTEHHYTAQAHVGHESLSRLDLPLIDIVSKQEVAERLNKLLVFS